MARAKYQVLVIPYHVENGNVKYCIFKRNDMKVWQFIAGGGEDEDETQETDIEDQDEEAGTDNTDESDGLSDTEEICI